MSSFSTLAITTSWVILCLSSYFSTTAASLTYDQDYGDLQCATQIVGGGQFPTNICEPSENIMFQCNSTHSWSNQYTGPFCTGSASIKEIFPNGVCVNGSISTCGTALPPPAGKQLATQILYLTGKCPAGSEFAQLYNVLDVCIPSWDDSTSSKYSYTDSSNAAIAQTTWNSIDCSGTAPPVRVTSSSNSYTTSSLNVTMTYLAYYVGDSCTGQIFHEEGRTSCTAGEKWQCDLSGTFSSYQYANDDCTGTRTLNYQLTSDECGQGQDNVYFFAVCGGTMNVPANSYLEEEFHGMGDCGTPDHDGPPYTHTSAEFWVTNVCYPDNDNSVKLSYDSSKNQIIETTWANSATCTGTPTVDYKYLSSSKMVVTTAPTPTPSPSASAAPSAFFLCDKLTLLLITLGILGCFTFQI